MYTETPKLFFSYARADAKFALKLATDLREAGVDLWMDQLDIRPGERWDRAVEAALKDHPCLLVILSPASVASHNVMDEVSYALEQNKQVLPVRYGECDIPFRLKRLQHVDFTSDYDRALAALLGALGPAEAEPAAEQAPPRVERTRAQEPPAPAAGARSIPADLQDLQTRSAERAPGRLSGRQMLIAAVCLVVVAVAAAVAVPRLLSRDDGQPASAAVPAIDQSPAAESPVPTSPPAAPAVQSLTPQEAVAAPQETIAAAQPLPAAQPATGPSDVLERPAQLEPEARPASEAPADTAEAAPDPLVARDLNRHGYRLFRDGRFDEAISTLTRAVDLQPDHPLVSLNLAKAYCGAGRFREAAATMDRAIRANPRLPATARGDGEFMRVCRPIAGRLQR